MARVSPCDFCNHPESEHRPACERDVLPTQRARVFRHGKCGCLFYVPPEHTDDLTDAHDAPGVPRSTWETGRPWWSA